MCLWRSQSSRERLSLRRERQRAANAQPDRGLSQQVHVDGGKANDEAEMPWCARDERRRARHVSAGPTDTERGIEVAQALSDVPDPRRLATRSTSWQRRSWRWTET